jgi:hypothetical protein
MGVLCLSPKCRKIAVGFDAYGTCTFRPGRLIRYARRSTPPNSFNLEGSVRPCCLLQYLNDLNAFGRFREVGVWAGYMVAALPRENTVSVRSSEIIRIQWSIADSMALMFVITIAIMSCAYLTAFTYSIDQARQIKNSPRSSTTAAPVHLFR